MTLHDTTRRYLFAEARPLFRGHELSTSHTDYVERTYDAKTGAISESLRLAFGDDVRYDAYDEDGYHEYVATGRVFYVTVAEDPSYFTVNASLGDIAKDMRTATPLGDPVTLTLADLDYDRTPMRAARVGIAKVARRIRAVLDGHVVTTSPERDDPTPA